MKVRWRRLTPDPFFFLCPLVLSTNAKLVCPKPFTPSQVYLKRLRITHQFFFRYLQTNLFVDKSRTTKARLPAQIFPLYFCNLKSSPWTLDIRQLDNGEFYNYITGRRDNVCDCNGLLRLVFNWCDFIKNLAFQKFCIRHHSILVPGTLGSRKV